MNIVSLFSEITKSMDLPQDMIGQINNYALGKSGDFNYNWKDFSFRSNFQAMVLKACARIPYGETKTYGKIAEEIGCPKAARAVGTALKNNPYPIIIPCHRVARKSGGLGGYIFGADMKRKLVEFESENLKKVVDI